MEQAFSADVLVPLGVGVAALVIAVAIVVTRAMRSRKRRAAAGAPIPEPTAADWTGELVQGPPPSATEPAADPAPSAAGTGEPRRLVTVAEAVAEREADTAPLPVQTDVLLARARAHRAAAERAAAVQADATRGAEAVGDAVTPSVPPVGAPTPDAVDRTDPAPSEPESGGSLGSTVPVAHDLGAPDTGSAHPAGSTAVAASARPVDAAREAAGADPADDTDARADIAADAVVSARSDDPDPAVDSNGTSELPAQQVLPGMLVVPPAAGSADEHGDAVAPTDERPTTEQIAALGVVGAAAAAANRPVEPAPQVPGPVSPENAASGLASPDPDVPQPAGPEPVLAQPVSADPAATEPAAPGATVGSRPAAAVPNPADQPDEAGSGQAVAAAVQNALAARARVADPHLAELRRGDARDRLLAVLLSDPVRAVGAAVELQAHQKDLARLTDELRGVVRRLAAAGLAPAQVAKLSGLDRAEVDRLLAQDQPR